MSGNRTLKRLHDEIQTLVKDVEIDLDADLDFTPVTIEELRESFERAHEEGDGSELMDSETFFNALNRLDALIDEAYDACLLKKDQLCTEDQKWLEEHPRDRIVGHKFFELRALQKEIARTRQYADTDENSKVAEARLAKARQRKRPKIIKHPRGE